MFGTALGILVVFAFILFSAHVLLGMFWRTRILEEADIALREVATSGAGDADLPAVVSTATLHARTRLGAQAAAVSLEFTWTATEVTARVRGTGPGFAGLTPVGDLDRVLRSRRELPG